MELKLKENNHLSKEEIKETVSTLESIKHVDEDGKEYWKARELGKALGYSRFPKFKNVVENSKEQMVNNGINPEDHCTQVGTPIISGKGGVQIADDYQLDRRACYGVAMEADSRKKEVAVAKEYFLQQTRKGEIADKVFEKMEMKRAIDARNSNRISNSLNNAKYLQCDVKAEELGIVNDAGDKGMFDMSTKELKEKHNIPENRPTADFLGPDVCAYKETANALTRATIDARNARGVDQVAEANFDCNKAVKDLVVQMTGKTPEEQIGGEDVKKLERYYNSLTKKQQKAIEQYC